MPVRTRALYSWKLPKSPETKDFQRRTCGRQIVVRSIELLYSVTGTALWPALVAFVVTLHHSRRPNAIAIAQTVPMSVFAPLGYSISKQFDMQRVGALSFG